MRLVCPLPLQPTGNWHQGSVLAPALLAWPAQTLEIITPDVTHPVGGPLVVMQPIAVPGAGLVPPVAELWDLLLRLIDIKCWHDLLPLALTTAANFVAGRSYRRNGADAGLETNQMHDPLPAYHVLDLVQVDDSSPCWALFTKRIWVDVPKSQAYNEIVSMSVDQLLALALFMNGLMFATTASRFTQSNMTDGILFWTNAPYRSSIRDYFGLNRSLVHVPAIYGDLRAHMKLSIGIDCPYEQIAYVMRSFNYNEVLNNQR
eukprot:NODE_739_length_1816_cov_23.698925_g601_i0.p3 GENE.NODE_739_length_1816_cov_23.698925_g601_i0~~NODE_739_length_1816_cov_23.698925_g601_i0.p3  ORF type:complete len:260 (+),score=30.44 NODE_739_length_1816_cov_23.698925_g601_i0:635-1414(+)